MVEFQPLNHASMRELQRLSQQRNTIVGLTFAVIFHVLLIVSYVFNGAVDGVEQHRKKSGNDSTIIVLQPTKLNPGTTEITQWSRPKASSFGIPVPIPEIRFNSDSAAVWLPDNPGFEGEGSGHSGGYENGTAGGTLPGDMPADDTYSEEIDPSVFQAVEIMPVPIKTVSPEYPWIAQRAGVEGTVWVKCLVDKTGKVRKAIILKSDAEVFNESSIEAIMQFLFKPAIMNNGPVSFWATVPFKFTLAKQ